MMMEEDQLKPGDRLTARDTNRYLVADQEYEVVKVERSDWRSRNLVPLFFKNPHDAS
jgi:hypothetical protein